MYDLREQRQRAATALRWRPDWPFALIIAAAWVALLIGDGPHAAGHRVGGPEDILAWSLMSVAMMAPLSLPALRHVGRNSIRARRQRAMLLFFIVYIGVWVLFGSAALAGEHFARQTLGIGTPVLLGVLLAVAAGWQFTPAKRRALLRCRRTAPLPPVGLRADLGCARFAIQQGRGYVTSSWPLMAVMVIIQGSALAWMAGLTAVMVAEELTPFGRRVLRVSAGALAVAAGLIAFGVETN